MFAPIFLFLFFLDVSLAKSAVKNPRDLVDEARQQLQELEAIVQGSILAAHNDLSDLEYDFLLNSDNVLSSGNLEIQQAQESVNAEITTVKELAQGQGVDVSPCTDIREELLNRLPSEYRDQLRSCIFEQNKQETVLITNAKYTVDIEINTVHSLEFQFNQCRGDLLCISPLLTIIELDKIRLPQRIATEVDAAGSLLTTLKLSVEECSDSKVSAYTGDAYSLLQDIIDCVNRILGGNFFYNMFVKI